MPTRNRCRRPVAFVRGLGISACTILQALPCLAQGRPAQPPPQQARKAPATPWWNADFEPAKKRAAERNCPLAVVLVQDGEEANERFISGVLGSDELRLALRATIPVLCNLGTGHETRVEKGKTICAKHGEITCTRHQELARQTFEYLSEKGSIVTPQLALLAPTGKVLQRVVDVHATADLAKAIEAAARQMGPSWSEDELAQVDAVLLEAGRRSEIPRPAALLGRLDKLDKLGRSPPRGALSDRIAQARRALLAELEERVGRARADLDSGKVYEALRECAFLLDDEAPGTVAANARAILVEAEKRPEGKKAKQQVELERNAFRGIARAEELARKGKKDLAAKEADAALRAAQGTGSEKEIARQVELLRARLLEER